MDQWLYQAGGMHIVSGFSQKATNGFIGITTKHELVMYDNKGNEFLRAPMSEVEAKFNMMANRLTISGKKYNLEFKPFSAGGVALGGLVGGAIAASMMKDKADPRSEREKRTQFVDLVNQVQSGMIRPAN